MKHRLHAILTISALVAMLPSAALAQYESSDRSPLGIRFVTYAPTGQVLKDIKRQWIAPMIDIHFAYDKYQRPSAYASVSWFAESAELARGRLVPITVTTIKHLGSGRGASWYFGAGTGLYYLNLQRTVPGFFTSELVRTRGTKLGLSFVFGREFGPSIFAELRYDKIGKITGDAGDADFSGYTLSVGSRLAF